MTNVILNRRTYEVTDQWAQAEQFRPIYLYTLEELDALGRHPENSDLAKVVTNDGRPFWANRSDIIKSAVRRRS